VHPDCIATSATPGRLASSRICADHPWPGAADAFSHGPRARPLPPHEL